MRIKYYICTGIQTVVCSMALSRTESYDRTRVRKKLDRHHTKSFSHEYQQYNNRQSGE